MLYENTIVMKWGGFVMSWGMTAVATVPPLCSQRWTIGVGYHRASEDRNLSGGQGVSRCSTVDGKYERYVEGNKKKEKKNRRKQKKKNRKK